MLYSLPLTFGLQKPTKHLRNSFNLGVLLLDFLELYGETFNYVKAGISVRKQGK